MSCMFSLPCIVLFRFNFKNTILLPCQNKDRVKISSSVLNFTFLDKNSSHLAPLNYFIKLDDSPTTFSW